jgi:hypothetical protein
MTRNTRNQQKEPKGDPRVKEKVGQQIFGPWLNPRPVGARQTGQRNITQNEQQNEKPDPGLRKFGGVLLRARRAGRYQERQNLHASFVSRFHYTYRIVEVDEDGKVKNEDKRIGRLPNATF